MKPPTISEEDEDADVSLPDSEQGLPVTADKDVSEWVIAAIESRRSGATGKKQKPALHAVSLEEMPKAPVEETDGLRDPEPVRTLEGDGG